MAQYIFTVAILLLSCSEIQFIEGARILAFFSVPSVNSQIVFRTLTEDLAMKGHHLVVITPDPIYKQGVQNERITEIDLHDLSYGIYSLHKTDTPSIRSITNMVLDLVDHQLSFPPVKNLIKNEREKFDMVIVESCAVGAFPLALRFNAPLVGISSGSGVLWNYEAMGNPTHPILYPDTFSYAFGKLSMWQKYKELDRYIHQRQVYGSAFQEFNAIAVKHFGAGIPSVEEIHSNMDLLLLNSHPILNGIRPMVPAIINLGSMHIRQKKPLPADLKALLDNSKQGVVYFGLGSSIMLKQVSSDKLALITQALGELPYTVIWRWEKDELPAKPNNVFTYKWLPQQDLLGHPNVKVFVTHGCQQAMEEAIHSRVPVVGIPFTLDQPLNVKKMEHFKIGKGVDISTLTKESFKDTILSVAKNESFKKNIMELAYLLEDQPMPPRTRAVWWVEYVLRHRGARHLRAPAAGMSNFEYFMLDVALIVLGVLSTVLLILYLAVRHFLLKKFTKRRESKIKFN